MADSHPEYVWCIAYINKTFLRTIEKDLRLSGYDYRYNIPTVRILKKRFKGKNFYDEIPLLFNYGFFRLPYEIASNREQLMRLKVAVNAIYNWLYKPADPNSKSPLLVHTIKISELLKLRNISLENSVYSSDDVLSLQKGRFIILRGFPFDNIPAEVISIDVKKEKVQVRLLIEGALSEASVNFSNIFYSVYSDCDEIVPHDNTIEGLMEKNRVRADKLYRDVESEF